LRRLLAESLLVGRLPLDESERVVEQWLVEAGELSGRRCGDSVGDEVVLGSVEECTRRAVLVADSRLVQYPGESTGIGSDDEIVPLGEILRYSTGTIVTFGFEFPEDALALERPDIVDCRVVALANLEFVRAVPRRCPELETVTRGLDEVYCVYIVQAVTARFANKCVRYGITSYSYIPS